MAPTLKKANIAVRIALQEIGAEHDQMVATTKWRASSASIR
jgi:hypothetical protein